MNTLNFFKPTKFSHPIYLKRDEEGNIRPALKNGEFIEKVKNVKVEFNIDDLTELTFTCYPAGWVE